MGKVKHVHAVSYRLEGGVDTVYFGTVAEYNGFVLALHRALNPPSRIGYELVPYEQMLWDSLDYDLKSADFRSDIQYWVSLGCPKTSETFMTWKEMSDDGKSQHGHSYWRYYRSLNDSN